MSFRGRYPSKFRRSSNFRGSERSFKERDQSFKRKYEDRGSPPERGFRENIMPRRGRQGDHKGYGRRGPLSKHLPNIRFPRSRGKFFRGKQGQLRGRGKFASLKGFNRELSVDRFEKPTGEWYKEEFLEEEMSFVDPEEWVEDDLEDDQSGQRYLERRSRSPLIIRRSFEKDEYDHDIERSLSRRSLNRTSKSPYSQSRRYDRNQDYRRLFDRSRSPEFHGIDRKRGSFEHLQSLDIESIVFKKHGRFSPTIERLRSEERVKAHGNRRSFERSLSTSRTFVSNEGSFQGSEREDFLNETSRRAIKRQIAIEKRKMKEMLKRQKKLHEKRSESSIERFLDDCKRSFENKLHSPHNSLSDRFERRDSIKSKRSHDRSLSPVDRPRKFRGLEHITIERGRSLDRLKSPTGSVRSFEDLDGILLERRNKSSPRLEECYRSRTERSFDRISKSPEQHKRRYSSQEGSVDINIAHSSSVLRSREPIIKVRSHFLGVGDGPFSVEGPIVFENKEQFIEELLERKSSNEIPLNSISRNSRQLEKNDLVSNDEKCFRESGDILPQQEGFISNISHSKEMSIKDDKFLRKETATSPISLGNSLEINEKSTRMDLSPISLPGSFENREYFNMRSEKSLGLSPVSGTGSFEKQQFYERYKNKLELSPVSQSESFDKREFYQFKGRDKMDLSPISQEGGFEKQELTQQNIRGLSPVSQNSFHAEENYGRHLKKNCEVERSCSADSMQQFLAELENDERSQCCSEKSDSQTEPYVIVRDPQFGGYKKHYLKEKEEKLPKRHGESFSPDQYGKVPYYELADKNKADEDDSYNIDKCDRNSMKNCNTSFEQKQQEVLYNAYEKPFDKKLCNAYNEALFQGRFQCPISRDGNQNNLDCSETAQQWSNVKAVIQNINALQFVSNYKSDNKLLNERSHQPTFKQFSDSNNSFHSSNLSFQPETSLLQPPGTNKINSYSGQQPFNSVPFNVTAQNISHSLFPGRFLPTLQPQSEFNGSDLNKSMFYRRSDSTQFPETVDQQGFGAQYQSDLQKAYSSDRFPPNASENNFNNLSTPTNQSGNLTFRSMPVQNLFPAFFGKPKEVQSPQFQQYIKPCEQICPPNQFSVPPKIQPDGTSQQSDWNNGNKFSPHLQHRNQQYGFNSSNIIPNPQLNVKDVIVISDDEGANCSETNDYVLTTNEGIVIPKISTVDQFRDNPPSWKVLGKIFHGFVLYFGVRENSELERDSLAVLKESFSKSEGFGRLDVEENMEYQFSYTNPKEQCILRWKGVMLARSEGETREEARQIAAISLINALAKSCYSIQAKYGYYNNGRLPKFMSKTPEKPGSYKIVFRKEIIKAVTGTIKQLKAQGLAGRGVDATHINAVISFMDEFFTDEQNHSELIFGGTTGMNYTLGELRTLSSHAKSNNLQCRWLSGGNKLAGKCVGVSRTFSPQALYRYLISGTGDTIRYRLLPPQGSWIDLLTANGQFSPKINKVISSKNTQNKYTNLYQSKPDHDQSFPASQIVSQPGTSQFGHVLKPDLSHPGFPDNSIENQTYECPGPDMANQHFQYFQQSEYQPTSSGSFVWC